MNKVQFIEQLRLALTKLPKSEIEKTILFYEESIADKIEDGLSEEEIIESFGDIQSISNELLVELPLSSLISSKIKDSKENAKNKTLWVIGAIFGFPIWFPILISLASVIFSVYVSVWAVVISLYAVELSLVISGASGLVVGTINLFSENLISGFATIGVSIMAIGLFIMSIKPLVLLSKKLILLTTLFLKSIKKLFIGRTTK